MKQRKQHNKTEKRPVRYFVFVDNSGCLRYMFLGYAD